MSQVINPFPMVEKCNIEHAHVGDFIRNFNDAIVYVIYAGDINDATILGYTTEDTQEALFEASDFQLENKANIDNYTRFADSKLGGLYV